MEIFEKPIDPFYCAKIIGHCWAVVYLSGGTQDVNRQQCRHCNMVQERVWADIKEEDNNKHELQ